MDLLNLWLTSNYFQYNGKHYKQLHGTAMGSPVSVVVAEIVMQHMEERALATCRQTIPLWLRYWQTRTHCCSWCFLGCANWETFVADTKCFWTKLGAFFCVPDTKFVSATNVARAGKRGNLCVGNNVSSFPRAFTLPWRPLPSFTKPKLTLFTATRTERWHPVY